MKRGSKQGVQEQERPHAPKAPKAQQSTPNTEGAKRDRTDHLLKQVAKMLKSLAVEKRKDVISRRLSQRQRLDLESFMTRPAGRDDSCRGSELVEQDGFSSSNEAHTLALCDEISEDEAAELSPERSRETTSSERLRMGPKHRDLRGTRGFWGYQSGGKQYYYVQVSMGWLYMQSWQVKSVEDAVERHVVLICILDHMRKSPAANWNDRVQCAVKEVIQEFGKQPEELKISFRLVVPSSYWIGRSLYTPTFRTEDLALLDEPLSRLRAARGITKRGDKSHLCSPTQLEHMWLQIKQAYLDVLAKFGKDTVRAAAQLDLLFSKQEPHREEIWRRQNERLMRRAEKEQVLFEQRKRKMDLRAQARSDRDQEREMCQEPWAERLSMWPLLFAPASD